MIGRKKLSEVRAELEAALGSGPPGTGEVAESLRRFLAAGSGESHEPIQNSTAPRDGGNREASDPAAVSE